MINDYIVFCANIGINNIGNLFFASNQEDLLHFFGAERCDEEAFFAIEALFQGYRPLILGVDEEGQMLAKGMTLLAGQQLLDKIAVIHVATPLDKEHLDLLLHYSLRHQFLIRTTERVVYDLWSR